MNDHGGCPGAVVGYLAEVGTKFQALFGGQQFKRDRVEHERQVVGA